MAETTLLRERHGTISERWVIDGDRVHVARSEDVTGVVDAVAKANSHGTAEIEGLGRLVAEVPLTVAMQFCEDRGIPWAKFAYTNEYDAEFKRFLAANPRFMYDAPTSKVSAH